MEEEDDDDEWRPQQFYLDVISGACEPIGGGHFWWGVGRGGEMIGIMRVCVLLLLLLQICVGYGASETYCA